MPEAVLLTGATGFVGRQVLAVLSAAGSAVPCRPPPNTGVALPGVTWHRADLLVPGGARAGWRVWPPRLIHCAWEVVSMAPFLGPRRPKWRSGARPRATWCAASWRRAGRGWWRWALARDTTPRSPAPGHEGRASRPWGLRGGVLSTVGWTPQTPRPQRPTALFRRRRLGTRALAASCGEGAGLGAAVPSLRSGESDPRRLDPRLIAACRAEPPGEVRAADLVRDLAPTLANVGRLLVALLDSPLSGACDNRIGRARSLGAILPRIVVGASRAVPICLQLAHAPAAGQIRR